MIEQHFLNLLLQHSFKTVAVCSSMMLSLDLTQERKRWEMGILFFLLRLRVFELIRDVNWCLERVDTASCWISLTFVHSRVLAKSMCLSRLFEWLSPWICWTWPAILLGSKLLSVLIRTLHLVWISKFLNLWLRCIVRCLLYIILLISNYYSADVLKFWAHIRLKPDKDFLVFCV